MEDEYETSHVFTLDTKPGRMYRVDDIIVATAKEPVFRVRRETLDGHLYLPRWDDGLRPIDIVQLIQWGDCSEHQGHADRVYAADLAYPILLYQTPTGYALVDGAHRLAKAFLDGNATMLVRYVTEAHLAHACLDND